MTSATFVKPDFILIRVQSALEKLLYEQHNTILSKIEAVRIEHRPYSLTMFCRIHANDNSINTLVAKTILHHPLNIQITEHTNQAVVEFDILKYLYPMFERIDKCSVPRPLLVIPELQTYVMEYVQGDLLMDEFRSISYFSSRRNFNELEEHLYYCGQWLCHLHQFSGIRSVNADSLRTVINMCYERLRLWEETSKTGILKNSTKKILAFLHDQLELLGEGEILVSGRHGDFGPWNILVNQDGITVLDFLGYHDDPLPVDLLKMLVHLHEQSMCITSNRMRVRALRESFLEGYGKIPYVPKPLVTLCEAFQRIIAIWISSPDTFHRSIELNIFRLAHLRWLTNDNARKLLWPCD